MIKYGDVKELYPNEVIEHLEEKFGIELTDYQKSQLYTRSDRTWLFKIKERNVKGSILWRLSWPLYFIWALVHNFILCPINWLVTGRMYFTKYSKINKFSEYWEEKLGI